MIETSDVEMNVALGGSFPGDLVESRRTHMEQRAVAGPPAEDS